MTLNLRLSFTAPIHAVINLFINILQEPDSPCIQADLALLDIGAGHFARVEFASSVISLSFIKDIASMVRTAVKQGTIGTSLRAVPTNDWSATNRQPSTRGVDTPRDENHSQHSGVNHEVCCPIIPPWVLVPCRQHEIVYLTFLWQAIDFEMSYFQPENLSMLLPGMDLEGGMIDFFNWEQ